MANLEIGLILPLLGTNVKNIFGESFSLFALPLSNSGASVRNGCPAVPPSRGNRRNSHTLTAAKPFSRSAMISSMCSVPMERRMVLGRIGLASCGNISVVRLIAGGKRSGCTNHCRSQHHRCSSSHRFQSLH